MGFILGDAVGWWLGTSHPAAMKLPRGWGTRALWVVPKEQATAKATAGPSTSLRMTDFMEIHHFVERFQEWGV
jgi:hypothetical protein